MTQCVTVTSVCLTLPLYPNEYTCCKHNNITISSLENNDCITEYPLFSIIVLNQAVLENAPVLDRLSKNPVYAAANAPGNW